MTGRMPRLLWVVDAPAYGGAEHYAVRCAAALEAESWFAASTPVPRRLQAVLTEHGLADRLVPVAPVHGKRDVLGFGRLIAGLRRLRPDLVHVNANAAGNARFGLAAALLGCRVPVVLTVHTAVPVESGLQRRVIGLLYRRCAAVIAVSAQIAEQLAGLGVDRRRLHVVRNGVRLPADRGRPAPSEVLRLGVLGRLTRQKGVDLLVEAVRLLVADGWLVQLSVGGVGPEASQLEEQASGLPVTFPGEVVDVATWLAELDVLVLPSRHEGLPFVLLEAMAAGVPDVATDVGDIREATGGTVSLVAPEDPAALAWALRQLRDPGTRAVAAAAARDRAAAALSEEAMVRETARVYAAAGCPVTPRSASSPEDRPGSASGGRG